jgi:hypothetical protein
MSPTEVLAAVKAATRDRDAAKKAMLDAANPSPARFKTLWNEWQAAQRQLTRRRRTAKKMGVSLPLRPVPTAADKIASLERKIAELRGQKAAR